MSRLFVLKQDGISSWICYLPIFDLILGYRQIKLRPKDYLDGVLTRDVSHEYIFMSLGLTNTFAVFIQHMNYLSRIFHKLVVEPIDDILMIHD